LISREEEGGGGGRGGKERAFRGGQCAAGSDTREERSKDNEALWKVVLWKDRPEYTDKNTVRWAHENEFKREGRVEKPLAVKTEKSNIPAK